METKQTYKVDKKKLERRSNIRKTLYSYPFLTDDIEAIEKRIKLMETSYDRLFKAYDYSATDGSQKSINPSDQIGNTVCEVIEKIEKLTQKQLEIDTTMEYIEKGLKQLTQSEFDLVKYKYFESEEGVKHDVNWLADKFHRCIQAIKLVDKKAINKFEHLFFDENGIRKF